MVSFDVKTLPDGLVWIRERKFSLQAFQRHERKLDLAMPVSRQGRELRFADRVEIGTGRGHCSGKFKSHVCNNRACPYVVEHGIRLARRYRISLSSGGNMRSSLLTAIFATGVAAATLADGILAIGAY